MYRDYDDELYHYGVIGMKWGTHLSKEVRGVKKAYKKKTEEQLKRYQEKWANHAPELQNKILKLYRDMDSAWDRNKNVKADRISNKIFELENELGRGHNKIDREYDELVKKSKKQYGKDLVEARLKAYNRLYRRPFRRKELQHYEEESYHYGIPGMKWGVRKFIERKEVRGVKKAYKDRERKIDDKFHKYVGGALATDKQLRTDRKQAIKDAKRNGGREAVKGVKSEYEKKLQALSDSFDKKMDKFGRDYDASKKTFKNERAVSNGRFASNYTKDVVNNNPQLRKIKDDIKNSPQVRKAQDKVNEYKSKLNKKSIQIGD